MPISSNAVGFSFLTRHWLLATRHFFLLFLCLLASSAFLHAEHTRSWRQSSYEEFIKGTPHGVAVRSDGRLELAPKFTLLADADASYLWSLRVDPKGVLYAAGGSPAKVFRFDTGGKPTSVFDASDLVAQAIAFDAKGALYVATSPDGKVYRVSSSGEKTVFFDPKTKYIWDLAFAADGTLYVATGDKGQIFAVAPSGKSELFYASDDAHIRTLAWDKSGNLLAGTEPNGRILRVTRAENHNSRTEKTSATPGEGFVLYETSRREITSLLLTPDGNIYAAAIGEKQKNASPAPSTVITTPQGTTTITSSQGVISGQMPLSAPFVAFPAALSSSIYRIPPDGAPQELWSSRDDVVYALGLNADGRLLAGTGNNGTLIAIDKNGIFAQLAKASSSQITGIARDASGRIFLCAANPGKVFSLGPEYESEGTYESRSFDTQLFSQWGRLNWWNSGTSVKNEQDRNKKSPVEFFVRSGNTEEPGKEWSRWFGPYTKSDSSVECPPARFAQWKLVIRDGAAGSSIDWVSLAYLPRNVAPVIEAIAVQDPGVHAQSLTMIQVGQQSANLRMPQSAAANGIVITQSVIPSHFEQPPQGFAQKGWQSVLWSAHDDNDDDLQFAVYYRGENETAWKLLKDKLDQKFYSWDSTALPDGAYYLKIVASDAPSNPPAAALTAERESDRFVIDNTPPIVDELQASHAGNASSSLSVKASAHDAASAIARAEYSVDGGDWILVAPVGNISDAQVEHYQFGISGLSPGEHTIAVRAFDRFENVGSAKTIFTIPSAPR